ncbi:hypothetical protein KKC97_04095 [bacterium]|nr:hypothetical protein [bacterium]MBU1636827.1 hypothetical protein [bacterium]
MKHALLILSTVIVVFSIPWEAAQAQAPATGVSWGFTRTYWDGKWYKDGYAGAGTGATMLSLRREMPVGAQTQVSLYISYLWMRNTISTLIEPVIVDPVTDEVLNGGMMFTQTHRSYYREYDVGVNLHRYLFPDGPMIYIGGGPLVRWGQSGRRNIDGPPPGDTHKATWFGLTVLAGYRTEWKGRTTFFEPQLTFSPDMADRWQENYPPVNLSFQMGMLW